MIDRKRTRHLTPCHHLCERELHGSLISSLSHLIDIKSDLTDLDLDTRGHRDHCSWFTLDGVTRLERQLKNA
jgi:hypothetical protein